MNKVRDDQGFILVSAMALLAVIMGLGLGLLLFTDNQQKASAREVAKESAFNVAEAALNAQIGQISRSWPGNVALAYPERCSSTENTAANGCPTTETMNIGYPNISPVPCAAGALKDAWGSPITNQWATYVRDDAAETTSYFTSSVVQKQLTYDANGDGKLWVRAVGVVQCQVVSLVTLVTQQFVTANFPRDALSANWFTTGNEGKGSGPIIDTKGKSSQPGDVAVRCKGYTGTEAEILAACAKYRKGEGSEPGQLSPETIKGPPGTPSPTLSASQLEALKRQAEWAGTYYAAGKCPEGIPEGTVVYVEGPCTLSATGNATVNSEAKPGFLVLANGTFEIGGNFSFWGTVYALNKQESSGVVITLTGNAHLHGAVFVDGNGGIEVGQSHKQNLEFDPKSLSELKTYAGTTPTRNTFRVLPINQ
jgi:Tfp pilus assembly protein PilX